MIRLVGLLVLVAGGFAAWSGYWYTRPDMVRALLIAKLSSKLPNVRVEVEEAHLRILGGIGFSNLRIFSKNPPPDMPERPMLEISRGSLQHDKQLLTQQGELHFHKMEIDSAIVRLTRLADGQFDWSQLQVVSTDDGKPLPTLVIRQASVQVLDHRTGSTPLARLDQLRATLLDDPPGQLRLELHAQSHPAGPIAVTAKVNRTPMQAQVTVDLPSIPIGDPLWEVAQRLAPEWIPDSPMPLKATARVNIQADYRPGTSIPLHYDAQVQLRNGTLDVPQSPLPIHGVEVELHAHDQSWELTRAEAKWGDATINLKIATQPDGSNPESIAAPAGLEGLPPMLLEKLRQIELHVRNLNLGPDLYRRLPPSLQSQWDTIDPVGKLNVDYKLTRETGRWLHRVTLRPDGMTIRYEDFRYPFSQTQGAIELTAASLDTWDAVVNIDTMAQTRPVTARGTVHRRGGPLMARLQMSGERIPLDDTLVNALPGNSPRFVRSLNATGEGDLVVDLFTLAGKPELHKIFRIRIHDATARYELFPLPLNNITGTVVIRPNPRDVLIPLTQEEKDNTDNDIIEIVDVRGYHRGSLVRLNGRKGPARVGAMVNLTLDAEQLPLDEAVANAVKPLKLEKTWRILAPTGQSTLHVKLGLHDRPLPKNAPPRKPGDLPFDPMQDLKVEMTVAGGAIQPKFFPYRMEQMRGKINYQFGQLLLTNLQATHHGSTLKIQQGEIRERADDGIWAKLQQITTDALPIDTDLVQALPSGLRRSVESLSPRGMVSLNLTEFVVDVPKGPLPASGAPSPAPGQPNSPVLPSIAPQIAPRDGSPILQTAAQVPIPSNDPANPGAANPGMANPGIASGRAALPATSPYDATGRAVRPAVLDEPTVYWDGSLGLHSVELQAGLTWQEMQGRIGCRGIWLGDRFGSTLGNLHIHSTTTLKQRVEDVRAQFEIHPNEPDVVKVLGHGRVYNGRLATEARMVMHPAGVLFDLDVTGVGLSLEEIARMNRLGPTVSMEGQAQARLYLGRILDLRTGKPLIKGNGSVDVENGRMLNLPKLIDLLKVLNMRAPDRTAFEEAHARFTILGDRMSVQQLDLLGNAISLGGEGEFDFARSRVKFEFYTIWSRMMKYWLSTPLGQVGASLSRELFKLEMEGDIFGELTYRKVAVPRVVDPLNRVMERMRSTRTGAAAPNAVDGAIDGPAERDDPAIAPTIAPPSNLPPEMSPNGIPGGVPNAVTPTIPVSGIGLDGSPIPAMPTVGRPISPMPASPMPATNSPSATERPMERSPLLPSWVPRLR
ncbi:hypothetical protein [Tuwongella immobilis]|nr:hypothetical protein [Tuwongella immobilis]